MRARSRDPGSPRTRAVPARTRLTVRRAARPAASSGASTSSVPAPTTAGRPPPSGELREALRVSREAIAAIRDELDALLRTVQAANAARGPGATGTTSAPLPRADAIERLARSTRRADAAVRGLSTSSP